MVVGRGQRVSSRTQREPRGAHRARCSGRRVKMNHLNAAIMVHMVGGSTLELELERLDARRRLHEEARSLDLRVGCTLAVEIQPLRATRSTLAVLVLRHDE